MERCIDGYKARASDLSRSSESVKRFLRITPRSRPVRKWKYRDGWCSIFPWEPQQRRQRTPTGRGRRSRKAMARRMPRSFRRSFVVGRATSCKRRARFGLSRTRTPSPQKQPVCLRARKSVDGRRCKRPPKAALSRFSRLSMALSQRFRGKCAFSAGATGSSHICFPAVANESYNETNLWRGCRTMHPLTSFKQLYNVEINYKCFNCPSGVP